ncbi:hypothetical protein CC80DRAFT_527021 [Byssothecium circinans]|uniref:Ubiquitin-like-conjugating enzyme ATG10 n=1 Tax=Byssothecium circinans TaxID=147558 RepID=A0A6A5TMP4_9PLEO|nr:hypothetical protein CC80DRAFT_527021 [Byssothecium circinans]
MSRISNFPQITQNEFEEACTNLLQRFGQTSHLQSEWLSLDHLQSFDNIKYLRITKPLPHKIEPSKPSSTGSDPTLPHPELDEDDEEALAVPSTPQPVIHYDIVLSPTYRVPVLYISIKDTFHRYPPTMSTLYDAIVPSEYAAQTNDFGVIGGITIADHPITNTPVYFIHPCKTAEVLEASSGGREMETSAYLLLWIGAMGRCVGFDMPLVLVASQYVGESMKGTR